MWAWPSVSRSRKWKCWDDSWKRLQVSSLSQLLLVPALPFKCSNMLGLGSHLFTGRGRGGRFSKVWETTRQQQLGRSRDLGLGFGRFLSLNQLQMKSWKRTDWKVWRERKKIHVFLKGDIWSEGGWRLKGLKVWAHEHEKIQMKLAPETGWYKQKLVETQSLLTLLSFSHDGS